MDRIQNRTFDEIELGDSASLVRTLTRDDVSIFAAMSGDVNPAHVDEEYARSNMFHKIIAHGMWGGALISTLLGTKLPGPGAVYLGQTLSFRRPVAVGDTITVTVTARAKDRDRHRVTFDCRCTNQKGEVVIDGTAEVLAPTEKVTARAPPCRRFTSTTRARVGVSCSTGPKAWSRSGPQSSTRLMHTLCVAPSMPPRPA
jgi:acyl dehydratase